MFKKSTQIYQEALKKIGHDYELTYQISRNNKKEETNQRKRKIIFHTAKIFEQKLEINS